MSRAVDGPSHDALTADQLEAVTRLQGDLFVAAGAGSGKTRVLTRRFVYAVATGYAKVDEILTITFTRKAAANMMEQIRRQLHQRKTVGDISPEMLYRMAEAYRNIETAQISTIDSFCSSLLRMNALAAGIDPDFSAIDESQSDILMQEVFEQSLLRLTSRGRAEVEFVTAYDPNQDGTLFGIVRKTFERLRSQGREATLPHARAKPLKPSGEELRRAVHAALAPCSHITNPGKNQQNGLNKLKLLAEALDEKQLNQKAALLSMDEIKCGSMGPAKEAFARLEPARKRYLGDVLSNLALSTLDLFRDLLEDFAARYERAKEERGVLDFGDLALRTRNLLRDNKDVRRQVSDGLKLIMVDEFQDTNQLQYDIVKMLARENLFVVGDENQSIYAFRYADVELFRQAREKARKGGYLVELKENFRSQQEILDFVEFIFDRDELLGRDFLELKASAEREPEREFRIDLVLVDKRRDRKKEGLQSVKMKITRPAEAQLIVGTIEQLLEEGYKKGDMAILLRTRSDSEIYRDALNRAGIENYYAVGSSYFAKLELNDVYSILKLIINPLDDIAFLSALHSPFVGLNEDALFWLRHAEGGEPRDALWERAGLAPDRLTGPQKDAFESFIGQVQTWRLNAARTSLVSLCRQIIEYGDYMAAIAAGQDGKQQYANLLKLLDLAADFEESWGNDLQEFVSFLEHQKSTETREGEAVTEAEGVEAVRMLTMHKAKGLEFPVVILPKLESTPGGFGNGEDEILLDRGGGKRIGLKLKTTFGVEGAAFHYDELKQEQSSREKEETRRLGYVAMTRPESHLVLSGVADAEMEPAPSSGKTREAPFDWLRSALHLAFDRDETLGTQKSLSIQGCPPVRLHVCPNPEEVAALSSLATGSPPRASAPGPKADIDILPEPAIYVPRSLSPTSLDTYAACPRRYYLQNELHVGDLQQDRAVKGKAAVEGGTLSAADLGKLVHGLLETNMPLAGTGSITSDVVKRRATELVGAGNLTSAERARAIELVGNLGKADISKELFSAEKDGRLKKEVGFRTLVGATILQGQIDALFEDGSATVVVDYKTGAIGDGRSPDDAAAAYRYQMASYALAAGRLNQGRVKVVLVFLGGPEPVEIASDYDNRQLKGLEQEIGDLIHGMAEAGFPSLDAFDEHVCNYCGGGVNGTRLCHVGRP